MSVFNTDIDVLVAGARNKPNAYVVFDNAQLGGSNEENMYLDRQNATVICAGNLRRGGRDASGPRLSSVTRVCGPGT